MSSPIDLTQLPAPNIIESLDYEQILANRKAKLLTLVPEDRRNEIEATLQLESEPLTILLEENALQEMVLRNRINDAARAVMLAYAKGADLRGIGANFNIEQLIVTPADPDAVPPVAEVREDEESLKLRIQEAFDGLSVAGPGAAYEFFARSAHGQVADARAASPAPCEVVIAVLSTEGDGTADQALLDAITAALRHEDIRPIGDLVTVQSAEVIPYEIVAEIYVPPGPESSIISDAAIQRAQDETEKKRPLGRGVYRSKLDAVLHAEGVIKVNLIEPSTDIVLTSQQAAYCTNITVTTKVMDV
ncbi:MAG TPA: baseplate J/gp47 family protein [Herbaspirillum sp.]|nr:baseplate J/gp47 family protein [Herbaspirillum sp.]